MNRWLIIEETDFSTLPDSAFKVEYLYTTDMRVELL